MDDGFVWDLFFEPLHADIKEQDQFYNLKPVLAHYTSLEVLESILRNEEVWFSNPLFMNDLEEVRFGISEGVRVLRESKAIAEALQTAGRRATFVVSLDSYISFFEREYLLDTYVFCLSEHDPDDSDGLLSMWRGYGGNGKGAALIFDASKFSRLEGSPLIFARVQYGSAEQRLAWCANTASLVAKILTDNHIPDDKIHIVGLVAFMRVKLFALFSKHDGFKEEKEWRIVYLSERDTNGKLKPMQHFSIGPRGVEPKLKLRVAPIDGLIAPDFSLDASLARIILGPSTSSALAVRSVERMLDVIGKPHLKDRLVASSIPLRPA